MQINPTGIVAVMLIGALSISTEAPAQVIDSAPNGFVVKSAATIGAAPGKVYDALVNDVGRWWDPAHTYSGSGANLSIDARAGGCFCERLEGQGSVQHASVIFAAPGRTLRLSGGLGPLQESGVAGSLTFDLAEKDGRTELTMTYVVGGYRQGGLQAIAAPVLSVLSGQLQRLQKYVENGSPVK